MFYNNLDFLVSNRYFFIGDEVEKICPDCGADLVFQGHCAYCPICGWSVCTT